MVRHLYLPIMPGLHHWLWALKLTPGLAALNPEHG